MKIAQEISNIKSTNSEIKEVRYNDTVVWSGGELIVKITFYERRSQSQASANSVYVFTGDPKKVDYYEYFKSGETRDIKPAVKNGKNYIIVRTTGGIMQSSLIIKEKYGNWQKEIIKRDEFIIGNTDFEIELVNASNNKEYIIEFSK